MIQTIKRIRKAFTIHIVRCSYFSLFEISLDKESWLGFSLVTFGEHDNEPRSLLQIAKAFDGSWYVDLMWLRVTPRL
jgi:hypothetical protein